MFYKILLSIFVAIFITACSTTSKDTAKTSGSGSTTASDDATEEKIIIPGSQEDLIVNVGDRVFFDYNSSELDADAQELLQDQVAWLKQHDVSITIEKYSMMLLSLTRSILNVLVTFRVWG